MSTKTDHELEAHLLLAFEDYKRAHRQSHDQRGRGQARESNTGAYELQRF